MTIREQFLERGRSLPPARFFSEYLELSPGVIQLAVDASIENIEFSYINNNEDVILGRTILYMSDSTPFKFDIFGGLDSALENGIDISVSGVVIANWKDNTDILCTTFDLTSPGGLFGNESRHLACIWQFFDHHSGISGLFLKKGTKFSALIQDDLRDLNVLRMRIQGTEIG